MQTTYHSPYPVSTLTPNPKELFIAVSPESRGRKIVDFIPLRLCAFALNETIHQPNRHHPLLHVHVQHKLPDRRNQHIPPGLAPNHVHVVRRRI